MIDRLLETDQGWIIIQNSGFAGEQKKLKSKALSELGDWCFLCRLGVKEVFQTEEVRSFVHFVMKGVVLEVL